MPEFEARTVKEAIAKGLETLGLSQDDVVIEIVDEGRSGVFGVGAKEAVVRITPKAEMTAETEATPPPSDETPTPASEIPESVGQEPEPAPEPESQQESSAPLSSEEERVLTISAEFLQGVLDRMGLQASVETQVIEDEEVLYRLNITGDDLGILIGRRAETLDALQYLTRLVVNQHTHRWYRIEVDVENYKRRREQSLQRLAQNMADRAVSEGRTIVLEPMPPRERRLVHLALRDREDVHTESIGEGDARKVTIVPN
jgi:spoIIIJ-associated protein